MLRRFSIGAALLALTVGASGLSLAQSESKPKTAKAVPLATVEAVQMPAWVDRGGASIPLAPGMELKNSDEVRTGGRSRVLIRTADGSAVKLGENASLSFDGMRLREDNVFEAALKVAEGAFRFTSEYFAHFRGKRDVQVSIRTVTAGIRGTDLWGKATPDRQLVCLIDGKIDVVEPKGAKFAMDEKFTVYVNENGVAQPVVMVPADQLEEYAAETEPQDGKGVSLRGGKWKVTIFPGLAHNEALDLYEGWRRSGYAAEIIPAKLEKKRVYNVRLSGFETKKDAEAVAADLKEQRGEFEYKVGR
jgi:FecR protein